MSRPPVVMEARQLTVSYRDRPALERVDLTVRRGQRIGVVGPNGSGKSTLLATCVGLRRPQQGVVRFQGRPLDRDRRGLAYLPQRSLADPDHPIRVRDVVTLGRYPHRGPVGRLGPDDRSAVERAIDRVGLRAEATTRFSALSGGMQQRALFARVLAQEAQVVLLDEPHAGVDAVTCEVLDACIEDVTRAGAAAVVVNHDLAHLEARYDAVLVLNRSRIAFCTPQAAIASEVLEAAYGVPGSGARTLGVPAGPEADPERARSRGDL